MPHNLQTYEGFVGGVVQNIETDQMPQGTLRAALNVRTDTIVGIVKARPGSQTVSTPLTGTGSPTHMPRQLGRLYRTEATYGYAHLNHALYRGDATWNTPTVIEASAGDSPLSLAPFVDGNVSPHLFAVNESTALKDNGTTTSTMGIQAATAAPLATKGTQHTRTINLMNSAAQWTGAGLTLGPSDETNVKIEGTGSVVFSIAADTLGSIAYGAAIDLSTFPTVLEPVVFEGTGLNDLTGGGTYSGTSVVVYEVEIDATGTPDTIKRRKDGGSFTTGIALTGAAQTLGDGLTFTAAATTGHTLGDRWLFIAHAADTEVADDDYISFWLRIDRPDFLSYFQIDVDLDTTTVANAFRTNYYSFQGSSLSLLNQGRDQWNELKIRKSAFDRFGTSTNLTWANAKAYRLSFLATRRGAINVVVDDFKLRGGFAIEGTMRYAAHYRNSTTLGRGNPYIVNGNVRYSANLIVDRDPVILNVSALRTGGGSAPSDTQIDTISLYRLGGNISEAARIVEISSSSDSAARRTVDTTNEADLILSPVVLETDNNKPPTNARRRVLFGPGALNRFFMIVGRNDLYYSKAWESDESRAENWPSNFRLQVSDGTEEALNGVVDDTEILVWTTRRTVRITGAGADTYLSEPIPESHGLAAEWGLTTGDNRVFFISYDGIYEQVGLRQSKLTGTIDRFFAGETVSGIPGLLQSSIATARLVWHQATHGPMLKMTYRDIDDQDRELVLKKDVRTGQYTICLFDEYAATGVIGAYLADPSQFALYALTTTGTVVQLEDDGETTDSDIAFPVSVQFPAQHQNDPLRAKTYTQVVVEMQTGGAATTIQAVYNRGAVTETLGTTSTPQQALVYFPVATPAAEYLNIAVALDATVSAAWQVNRWGCQAQVLPERIVAMDSDEVALAVVHLLQRFEIDVDAPQDMVLVVYRDGLEALQQTLPATQGRRRQRIVLPGSVKGRMFRATITSTGGFILYNLTGWIRPLNVPTGYASIPFNVRGAA